MLDYTREELVSMYEEAVNAGYDKSYQEFIYTLDGGEIYV